jgi:hypothetical protein
MEVCLFDKHANASQLILVDTIHKNDKTYFKDSLDSIRILPSKHFYEATNKKLSEGEPLLTDEGGHYKKYSGMMKNWIKVEVQNGMEKVEAQHYHFNLRTKLKI